MNEYMNGKGEKDERASGKKMSTHLSKIENMQA